MAHSEATKRKISVAQRGRKNSFYGRAHNPSTRAQWSRKRKGKNNPMFGKKHSAKTIAKMRAAVLKRLKAKR